MWTGSVYTDLGTLNGEVNSISAFDAEHVYIGGNFTAVNTNNLNKITMWNGASYTALGSGFTGTDQVRTIHAFSPSEVYIGTQKTTSSMWNGNIYTQLGTSMINIYSIYALDAQHIYIGSPFGVNISNGTSSTALFYNNSNNLGFGVRAIYALDAQHIYIGGNSGNVIMWSPL
jgi:hypothetical protein